MSNDPYRGSSQNRKRQSGSSRSSSGSGSRSSGSGSRSSQYYGSSAKSTKKVSAKKKKARRRKKIIRLIVMLALLAALIALAIALVSFIVKSVFGGKSSGDAAVETEEAVTEVYVGLNNVDYTAQITQYFTYGTSLCIDGTLDLSEIETDEAELSELYLVLRKSWQEEDDLITNNVYSFELDYTIVDTELTFTCYTYINDGIYLEDIDEGSYTMLIRAVLSDESVAYFTFTNASGETDDICYYTITDVSEGTNNRIDVSFETYGGTSYMAMVVEQDELPDDVYDIVIDAGHGGIDSGATNGEYYESELMLEYALAISEALEDAGFKVLLTRDGTEDENENTAYSMYDEDGRVNVTAGSGAKYCLSLHLNSNSEYVTTGGIQCYISCRASETFASLLVDTIVEYTGTNYSSMSSYQVTSGVYSRAYTESEIEDSAWEMEYYGMEAYDITTDTDYYYMIRETGGIATNAYVDGRSTDYGTNLYMDSVQGVETYLMELGFITVDSDLYSILYSQDEYVQAIVDSFLSLQ